MDSTKPNYRNLRRSLTELRTPSALKDICDKLRREMTGEEFFNKGGLSFMREAIIAADFGVARDALLARLIPEDEERPDFELTFPDRIERFELVEADKDGRRRGDEYKRLVQKQSMYVCPIDIPSQSELIEIVKRAASKKTRAYPDGTHLLIYINLPRFPSDMHILAEFSVVVSEARPFFSTIWVTWQGGTHQV